MGSEGTPSGQETLNGIYRFTSIGRPLDPDYPTNRAVLLLMPAAAIVAGALAFLQGDAFLEIVERGLIGAAVALGGWALARELLPDVDAMGFVSLVLAFSAFLVVESSSLLLLFVALFLVRTVNRTVGLPARTSDSILVVLLTVWATYGLPFPWLSLIGALTFALDAALRKRLHRQWIFAGVCLVAAGLSFDRHGLYSLQEIPLPALLGMPAIIGVGYGLTMWRTPAVKSLADVTGIPLSLERVRAGMVVAFLVGLQSLTRGQVGIEAAALVWASLAGVSLGGAGWLRRPRQTPTD